MGDFTLTIGGFPPALSGVKLRLFIEKRVAKGLIRDIDRMDDGLILLKFNTERDMRTFRDANVTEIEFGNETHRLTVLNETRTDSEHRHRMASNHDPKDNDPWRRKLYVTNIPQHLCVYRAFRYHFERFGVLEKCYMNDNKSFAYVTFYKHVDALAARYGARSVGPDGNLVIKWEHKEGMLPYQPQPLMSIPLPNPWRGGGGQGGPRQCTSTTDLRQVERQPTRPRRQPTVAQDLNEMPTYTVVHYWSSFTELPAKEGTMCVLAQNIDASTHMQNIKMHFESKKRSNGGLVRSFIRMVDGLLIIFQDPKDCESCLEMKDQKFADKNLVIFGKRIPTYFERKFVVEGVGPSIAVDTLTMFLEGCSSEETSPISCKKQSLHGVYLIEYGDDFDLKGAEEILRNIQKKTLEDKLLKGSRLLRTDCLKVTGVKAEVSSDTIRLKFESRRRTDGGPVTRVDRLKNKATLVYFAEFSDAERVYERFKNPSVEALIIGQDPVEVELYFHSFANDHKNTVKEPQTEKDADDATAPGGPKRPLRSYDLQPGCDEKILFFIKNNQTHSEKLLNCFKDFASVQLSTEKKGNIRPFVKLTPDKKNTIGTQKNFNAECKKRFEAFLTDYSSISPTFDQSKLQKARSAKLSPLLEKSYKGDGINVIADWKNDSVDVTGMKEAMNKFVDQIIIFMDYTVTKMATNVDQYRMMVSCGIIEELQQKHPTVTVKCDDRTQSVTLTGPNDVINTVQISALTMLNTIEKKRLTGLDDIILRFLAEMIKESSDIKMQIQDKLKNDGVKAALSADGDDVYICVRTTADYQRAVDSIKQLIDVKNIPIDEASSAVVSTPLWKGFHQSLKGIGSFRVYVKTREAIIIVVGVRAGLQSVQKKINDFLDENATRRFCVQMPYGSARFIVEKSKEFSDNSCGTKGIKCGLAAEEGGVFVEGKRKALEKARPQMVQLTKDIAEIKQTLKEPGIKQYYQGEDGKEFLRITERVHDCIILAMNKSCPEWQRTIRRNPRMEERGPASFSAQTPQEQLYISGKLPNSQVTLQVWKTNIIEHKCDVIVNASNPQLQLLAAGVSGVIKNMDIRNGNVIQNAMKQLIRNNHSDFLSGDAPITTAGNLKNCKRIVHAVGPKWDSASEKNPSGALKACIFKSLEETDRVGLTSIAIPAISCGVFGGKVNVCIPLISEAVVEYFKEKKTTSIKRVDFVENQKQEVLKEFKSSVQKYRDPNSESGDQQQAAAPTPRVRTVAYSPSSASPNVKLLTADIASIQADVIVNITSPEGFPTMQGSSVAKALLKMAGHAVQKECAQTAGPHKVASVFRTTGGRLSCREIYHGIVSNYASNSKQIVKGIVSTCLKMADNAGYSTIAFPAIATGGFSHPAGKVARWMRKEISSFTAVNLTDVIVVLYPQDTLTISIFQAEFRGAPRPSPSKFGKAFQSFQLSPQTAGNFGAVSVNVYQGDITQEASDAIVNSANSKFDLSQGMVSKAIIAQGGSRIQTEAQSGAGTDFRMTSGGNLPCQSIFHIVTPSNEKDIATRAQMVLDSADQQGLRSISFPALATGNIGLTSASVALTMRRVFEKFGKSGVNTLKTINVVVFDQSMLNDFKTGILAHEPTFFGRVKESINSFLAGSPETEEKFGDEKFDLFFYSSEVDAINRAFEAITRETRKMVHCQVIQDETFGRLSAWELWELKEVAIANKVKITDKSSKYLNQMAVEGLMRDVMKAHEAVKDVMKEFCEAETTASFVTWQKSVHGAWEDYHPRSANILEKANKRRNGNTTDPKLNKIKVPEYSNHKVHEVIVDLSNLGDDANAKNPPMARRRVKEKAESDVVPSFWDPMQNQPYLMVPLQQSSQEYQTAFNKFIQTGGTNSVVKIERIQNISLYKQYIAKKAEVTKKVTSGNPVERELFHGTADDDKIMLHGFDRSYAGKNATAYGRGVYFAKNASYSNGYAVPNSAGQRRMFLADVITGDYCPGNSAYIAPPARQSGIKNDLYESVVDNVNAPTIFVIFKDASAYPKFLITY